MSNWFYEDSASHIGWTIPEGNRKKGKTKNIRKWQNVPDKSKASSLMNPDPIQTKTGKTRQRPDTNNQASSTFFNSNSGSIFDKAKDRMNKAKEADLNSSTLNRMRNQANSSRQRALEMEKQRPVMTKIRNAQRKSSEPPVKGWDMLKPENRPAGSSPLLAKMAARRNNDLSAANGRRISQSNNISDLEKYYYSSLTTLKGTALTEFVKALNNKITYANTNGATASEIEDIEAARRAIERYNRTVSKK